MRGLYWPHLDEATEGSTSGIFDLGELPIVGRVLSDSVAANWLQNLDGVWQQETSVRDRRGAHVASIWRDRNGGVFLPFDPNEMIGKCLGEEYSEGIESTFGKAARSRAKRVYYRVRPALPRRVQIAARRFYSRFQAKQEFPRWPIETALHDLYALLLGLASDLLDEPLPILSAWPKEYSWAFVLTHDVETSAAYDAIPVLRTLESNLSLRSSWNFVPANHLEQATPVLDQLRADGCEVGVHGLYHDGRDISEFDSRLPAIQKAADDWQAVGFRSPSTLRDREVMARLPFEYDSSYSLSAPYEPQPGGCCSWLPYMIGDVVELPITLPQDHALFEILTGYDETLWIEKTAFLRERGGLALVLTHPDYADNPRLVKAYRALLSAFADDDTAWKALPREVNEWWRARAASHLARDGEGWTIVGPVSQRGSVTFVAPVAGATIESNQS